MKKQFLSRILLLTLLIALVFSGCSLKEMKDGRQADAGFDRFTDQLFAKEVTANTLNLHYIIANPERYGITDYPITLGEFSLDGMEKSMAAVDAYVTRLEDMPYDALSSDRQLTYDCIYDRLKTEQQAKEVLPYTEILSAVTGFQAQLPVLLAEYAFYDKQDVEDYLALLEQVRPYFHQVLLFEQDKANAGLFMPDFAVDDIVDQCTSFIGDTKDHFLISSFARRLEKLSLSDKEKRAYIEKNQKALDTCFFPAYADLIQGLEDLRGKGTNPYGLCHFPLGRQYYSYLVAQGTGSSFSVEDLFARILDSVKDTSDRFSDSLKKIQDKINAKATESPRETPAATGPVQNTNAAAASFGQEQLIQDPRACLEDLREKCKADFPALFQVEYTLNQVDESLEDYLSPAFYLTPALDTQNNVIYINKARGFTPVSLYTTLAHEGFPGHLYQNMYTRSLRQDKIRALFGTTGYAEGWATYAEMLSYQYLDMDQDLAAAYRESSLLSLGISAAMDIGIHYQYWTPDDAYDFLSSYGYSGRESSDALYEYIVEEPANYLNYYVGYLEFLRLRQISQDALGEKFDKKAFHESLLNIGEAPFSVVEKYLRMELDPSSADGR